MSQAAWFARRINYLQLTIPGLQAAYGSNTWNWCNALAMADNDGEQLIQQGIVNASLANATGPALYAIGAAYGVYVQPAVAATAPVVFSLNPVNPSASTVIPAGAVVMTPPAGGQAAVQFTTGADATIPANSSNSNTVTATCSATGMFGNVPINSITVPYSGVPAGVTVTNSAAGGSAGYVAGAPQQSDDSYRASVYKAIQIKTAAARIEAVAEQVTGSFGNVFAAHVVDAQDGLGNYTVYVCDIDGNASSDLQAAVTTAITAMGNIGLTLTVAPFTLVTQPVTGTLTLQSGAVFAAVQAGCVAAMDAWGNTLPPGTNLLPTDLILACYGQKQGIGATPGLLDLTITTPSAPISASATEIVRLGTISLSLGTI